MKTAWPWCTALPPHAQDNSGGGFGILFSHASEMVWPDLVGRAFPDEEAARAYGETVVQAQGGIEFAVMCRRADRPGWMEVGTGQNAHQVLARQWSERIAGRFAAGALH